VSPLSGRVGDDARWTSGGGLAVAEAVLRERTGDRVRSSFSLAPLTTFRIGGPAALYLEAESDADLEAVAAATRASGVAMAVVGRGSNMLVSDAGFPGVVVKLGRAFRWASRDGDRLSAGGAMPLPALAGAALSHGLAGVEFGVAIPATLGGAVRMNAGAHGREMSNVVELIDVFDVGLGRRRTIGREEAGFAYRRSSLGRSTVIVGATVGLSRNDIPRIRERMDEARRWRRATQPLAEPNCGSVFTNPPGDHAARLVEEAGAKGLRVGGAAVSTKHANFIVAAPGARASDVVELVRRVRALVEAHAGIRLETEVHLLGDFDDVS
jgi:UDP-N-acetylmuramate dehydrogenase